MFDFDFDRTTGYLRLKEPKWCDHTFGHVWAVTVVYHAHSGGKVLGEYRISFTDQREPVSLNKLQEIINDVNTGAIRKFQ